MYDFEERLKAKMRSDDRLLILKPMEGKEPLSSKGIIDKRIFKGNNNLHAKREKDGVCWYLEYEHGELQEALKQKFTSFTVLLKFVQNYFKKRNVEVVEIKD